VSDDALPSDGEPHGSPIRSLFSVIVGWVVLWLLGALYASVVYRLAPAHFPAEAPPTATGMALMLAGAVPNGIVGGLITARLAGVAPLVHAAILAGVLGFFGLMSSDAALGMPGWFAIARPLLLPLAIVGGGAIARWVPARGAPKRT
jgi:hypothetical protein